MNKQQIDDLKRFCATGRTVLGVNKTYDLGGFLVTPTIYKDLSVVRTTTREHPITFGPTFIHTDSSWLTYNKFFHGIDTNLSLDDLNDDFIDDLSKLVIGSDKDDTLKESIRRCFRWSTHTLCTQNLQENTLNYMEKNVGYSKSNRQRITSAIYGEDGLLFAGDTDTFDFRLEKLKEKIASVDSKTRKKFMPYFNDKLLPLLTEFVINPANDDKIQRGWTNNKCESANHIFNTEWRLKDVPTFINMFGDIVNRDRIERSGAIHGMGGYELFDPILHHKVDSDKRPNMSEVELNRNVIVPTNGLRTLRKTPTAGKRANQGKRKRVGRSHSRTSTENHIVVA
jgi:hypothetical protein